MAYILRSSVSGNCCACDKQVDACTCNNIPCSAQCRSKADVAAMCGWPELGPTPSIPPRLYLTKKTIGTMYHGRWSATNCSDCATPPSDVIIDLGNGPFITVAFMPGTWDGVHWSYKVTIDQSKPAPKVPPVPDSRYQAQILWGSSILVVDDGAIVVIDPCSGFAVTAVFKFGAGANLEGATLVGFTPPNPITSVDSTRDDWNDTEDYKPAIDSSSLCDVASSGANAKHATAGGIFPLASGGTAGAAPSGDPSAYYPAGEVDVTISTTLIDVKGKNSCHGPDGSGDYGKYQGEVTVALTNEDTEAKAQARAEAAIPSWSVGVNDCDTRTAFLSQRGAGDTTFAFRDAQVQISMPTLLQSTSYKLTIRYYRRVLDSGGPFLFFQAIEVDFGTGLGITSDITDWIAIPNEDGFETRYGGCLVEIAS